MIRSDTFRNGLNWSRSTFSPDGKYVAAGSTGDIVIVNAFLFETNNYSLFFFVDGGMHIWNVKTGKVEREITEHR